MKKSLIMTAFMGVIMACQSHPDPKNILKTYKDELVQTENSFEKMAADSGLPAAFSHYVADSGVVIVKDTLFMGKVAVRKYYQGWTVKDVSLKWSPDYVDVSASGDLGYTYGRYTISFKDSTGAIIRNHGIFHTVWKRQPDGSWRFVWD
jgi:ketosteroid isomerase-like protein